MACDVVGGEAHVRHEAYAGHSDGHAMIDGQVHLPARAKGHHLTQYGSVDPELACRPAALLPEATLVREALDSGARLGIGHFPSVVYGPRVSGREHLETPGGGRISLDAAVHDAQ